MTHKLILHYGNLMKNCIANLTLNHHHGDFVHNAKCSVCTFYLPVAPLSLSKSNSTSDGVQSHGDRSKGSRGDKLTREALRALNTAQLCGESQLLIHRQKPKSSSCYSFQESCENALSSLLWKKVWVLLGSSMYLATDTISLTTNLFIVYCKPRVQRK